MFQGPKFAAIFYASILICLVNSWDEAVKKCEFSGNGNKVNVVCKNFSSLYNFSDVLKHLDFEPIRYLRIYCDDGYLPEAVFTNVSIETISFICPFMDLEDASLSRIQTLTVLRINKSKFRQIPKSLGELTKLRTLLLHKGDLEEIGNELQNMSNLRNLFFVRNRIATISRDAFLNTTRLQKISFAYNNIKEFIPGTFRNCRNIELFTASLNKLESIKWMPYGFYLKVVDLRNNSIYSMQEIFVDFPNIQVLLIGRNVHLQNLSDSTFSYGLLKLKKLDMSYSTLTTLPPKLVQPLPSLEHIDLKINRLRTVPFGFFYNLQNLKYVNLGKNNLVAIDHVFMNNIHLERVILSHNKIQTLNNSFSDTPLRRLDVGDNNLSRLSRNDFAGCRDLTELRLNSNKIDWIDSDTFDSLKNLKILDLSANRLKILNGSVRFLENLEYLNVTSNKLEEIDENDMFRLIRLKSLNLINNKLKSVNGAFKHLHGLKNLEMAKNKLKSLSRNSFPKNIYVQDFHLNEIPSYMCICEGTGAELVVYKME